MFGYDFDQGVTHGLAGGILDLARDPRAGMQKQGVWAGVRLDRAVLRGEEPLGLCGHRHYSRRQAADAKMSPGIGHRCRLLQAALV